MNIKRYTAGSMRAALAAVREEQGPDAVILSSKKLEDGVEVIAAVDYDEALIAEASKQLLAKSDAEARPREPLGAPQAPSEPPPPIVAAPPTAMAESQSAPIAQADGVYDEVRRELKDLRGLLEVELATLAWQDSARRDPRKARVLEVLASLDVAPDVANSLAAEPLAAVESEDPLRAAMALILKNLPVMNDTAFAEGGIFAVVGPTGAGKTTTIAKLAARWAMQRGAEQIALISTDSYRVGAREQLLTYARILGVPMHFAANAVELEQCLGRLKKKQLVLIDTAGMGQRDARLAEQLATLEHGAARAEVLLALPANGECQSLDEIMRAFARAKPKACVLTKVDEAASLGGAFSTLIRRGLPVAYVCDGQRVPEDLHAAHNRRLWLVSEAMQLQEAARPRADTGHLVRRFAMGGMHA